MTLCTPSCQLTKDKAHSNAGKKKLVPSCGDMTLQKFPSSIWLSHEWTVQADWQLESGAMRRSKSHLGCITGMNPLYNITKPYPRSERSPDCLICRKHFASVFICRKYFSLVSLCTRFTIFDSLRQTIRHEFACVIWEQKKFCRQLYWKWFCVQY